MQDRRHAVQSVGIKTSYYFQFITTPTSDTPGTSLLVHFDDKRYIFGEIAEGTQRACIQGGVGLKKVRGLFLTGKTSWNNGGLLGLILTLAEVQQEELETKNSDRRPGLKIYGGPKQLHTLACARRFIFRTGMPLSVHEAKLGRPSLEPTFEDENIRVWAIAARLRKTSFRKEPATDDSDFSDKESDPLPFPDVNDGQVHDEQCLRRDIINNMFDSDWHKDRLTQRKLAHVKLPARVWVRDPDTKQLTSHALFNQDRIAPLTLETDVLVRDPWPATMVEKLPTSSNLADHVSMSYIMKGHPQRGKFDPIKAKAFGLRPGPAFAKLAAGYSVESDTGVTVTPEMVLSPTKPGKGLAIFDLPSTGYLFDLQRQIDEQPSLLDGVETFVWITAGSLPYTPIFQQFLSRFKNVRHVLSHPDLCKDYIVHNSSAASMARLTKIAPDYFSIPRFNSEAGYYPAAHESPHALTNFIESSADGIQITAAQRGSKMYIEPDFRVDNQEVPRNFDPQGETAKLEQDVLDLLPKESLGQAPEIADAHHTDLPEPEIITLGTGSSAPSKYRNVSAVMLRMPANMGNYLFDCGEGTLGQLRRIFDAAQLDQILCGLKAIWISHLHADHHLGTTTLLQAAYEARRRRSAATKQALATPPLLISESKMINYMDEYRHVLRLPLNQLCVPVICDGINRPTLHGKIYDFNEKGLPIRTVQTGRVSHCHGAQAISITFDNDFKFSYSGDCRPSDLFCLIGRNSDVLVHEATFDDGMEGDAIAKKHSTTGEALGVAIKMKAKNLILTHFSQRYQKIPVLSSVKMPQAEPDDLLNDLDDGETAVGLESAETKESNIIPSSDKEVWANPSLTDDLPIAIAFDLMRIRVSQIAPMRTFFPAISRMFETLEDKAEQERQERARNGQGKVAQKQGVKKDQSGGNRLAKRVKEPHGPELQQSNAKRRQKTAEKSKDPKSHHAEPKSPQKRGESGSSATMEESVVPAGQAYQVLASPPSPSGKKRKVSNDDAI